MLCATRLAVLVLVCVLRFIYTQGNITRTIIVPIPRDDWIQSLVIISLVIQLLYAILVFDLVDVLLF